MQAASGNAVPLDPATCVLAFSFIGSSTPPPYHKEYVITAKAGTIEIRVGTYGTVSGQTPPQSHDEKPLDTAAWQHLLSLAERLPDESGAPRIPPGGSRENVTVTVGDGTVKHGVNNSSGVDEIASALRGYFDLSALGVS
jgi:hypothetical protein